MNEQNGVSEIMSAVYNRQTDVVTQLLASGVELNIYEAAATGQTKRLQELIEADPALVNSHSFDGFTPLGLAVFFGQPEASEGAARRRRGRQSAFARSDESDAARVCFRSPATRDRTYVDKHGANVNARAANDFTPLHESAASGKIDFAELLIEHGADVNAKTTDGKTPLVYARERGHEEIVELLNQSAGDANA